MIETIRKRVENGDYRLTIHAFERCVERNISPDEMKHVMMFGEIIENYPEDKYGPSCLICGVTEKSKRYYMCNVLLILFGLLRLMIRL